MVERYEEIKAISLCTAGSVGAAFSIKRLTTPDNGNVAIFKDAEHTIENIGLPRGARLRKRMVTPAPLDQINDYSLGCFH
jgi:hypothetical protein